MVTRERKSPEPSVQGWPLMCSTAEAVMELSSAVRGGHLGWTSSTLSVPLARARTLANGPEKSTLRLGRIL
jgi:hypothetical protein